MAPVKSHTLNSVRVCHRYTLTETRKQTENLFLTSEDTPGKMSQSLASNK